MRPSRNRRGAPAAVTVQFERQWRMSVAHLSNVDSASSADSDRSTEYPGLDLADRREEFEGRGDHG